MEEIINIATSFLTDPTQIVLFLFSGVFYRQWSMTSKRLEKMHRDYHEDYVEIIKDQTKSSLKLSESLTLLAERVK